MSNRFQWLPGTLAGAALALTGCGNGNTQPPPPRGTTSSPAVASYVTPGQIKAQCVIQSQRAVKLKAELGGRIDSVAVTQGEAVEPGQLLARIGTQEQSFALERLNLAQLQAQARIELLTAQIQQAQANWQAMQPLYKDLPSGVQPKEALALREKESELKLTRLSVIDLHLQIKNLQRVMRQAEIRSPLRAVVLARNAEVGMVVAPGISGLNGSDILFELGDPDKLRAECAARESDASQLRRGLPMKLVLDGMRGQDIALSVSRIAPAIQNDAGSSSLPFWGDFDRPTHLQVLAGMHGHAAVQLEPQTTKTQP